MARYKDSDWNLPGPKCQTWEQAQTAVLMDIRDELRALNRTLNCHNFQSIPTLLRRIQYRIPARRPRKRREKTEKI